MNRMMLVAVLAVASSVFAQTKSTTTAKAGSATAAKSGAAKSAAGTHAAVRKAPAACGALAAPKTPAGLPEVKAAVQTVYSVALRYQDVAVGTGEEAAFGKLVRLHYTGWLAEDGHKFDSSFDHPGPQMRDKDGKPLTTEDGKPKLAEAQPITVPLGYGRVIPGMEQGVEGMKVGGKRRIFIPYQLAYGSHGRPTNDPKNPGIPPKADLIFDVELVSVNEMPTAPQRPMGMPGRALPQGAAHPAATAPATAPATTPAAAPATAPATTPAAGAGAEKK